MDTHQRENVHAAENEATKKKNSAAGNQPHGPPRTYGRLLTSQRFSRKWEGSTASLNSLISHACTIGNTTGAKGAHVPHDNSPCRTLTQCQNLTFPARCLSEDEKDTCSSKSKPETSQFEHWSLRCCGERLVTQLAMKALGASLVERLIVLENVGEKKKSGETSI